MLSFDEKKTSQALLKLLIYLTLFNTIFISCLFYKFFFAFRYFVRRANINYYMFKKKFFS